MPGEVKTSHTGGKCVNRRTLHNSEIKITPVLALEWAICSIQTYDLRYGANY